MILLMKARAFGVHNVPEKGGALLVCNHQSFFDPLLAGIPLSREAHFMARDSLFHNPVFGRLIKSVNSFPVRRNSADLGAIKEAMRRLKQGRILILFPEGTRSPDGKIGVMFPGMAAIAKKVCVPVIPTIIDGMYQAWPRNRKLPGVGDVIVEYDQPIMPAEYADLTADQLMDLIRTRLIAMQERWHSRMPWRRLK
jgi:1-acyl-sn-glycerol-3-phosphate acyltransferase